MRAQLSCWYPKIEGRLAAGPEDGRRRGADRHGHAPLRSAGVLRRPDPARSPRLTGNAGAGLPLGRRLDDAAGVRLRRPGHGRLLLLHPRRGQPHAAGDLRLARGGPHRRHDRPEQPAASSKAIFGLGDAGYDAAQNKDVARTVRDDRRSTPSIPTRPSASTSPTASSPAAPRRSTTARARSTSPAWPKRPTRRRPKGGSSTCDDAAVAARSAAGW